MMAISNYPDCGQIVVGINDAQAGNCCLVTHNATIAVLGYAELNVLLKSTSLKSLVINSGSFDKPETRDLYC